MTSHGFVSTGSLPASADVAAAVQEVHARYRDTADGLPSAVYPALARANPNHYGVCLVDVYGRSHSAGDVDTPFTIMSVAKPFVFALACRAWGPDAVRDRIGVDATGLVNER